MEIFSLEEFKKLILDPMDFALLQYNNPRSQSPEGNLVARRAERLMHYFTGFYYSVFQISPTLATAAIQNAAEAHKELKEQENTGKTNH